MKKKYIKRLHIVKQQLKKHSFAISLRCNLYNERLKDYFFYVKNHLQEKNGTKISNISFLKYCLTLTEKHLNKKEV